MKKLINIIIICFFVISIYADVNQMDGTWLVIYKAEKSNVWQFQKIEFLKCGTVKLINEDGKKFAGEWYLSRNNFKGNDELYFTLSFQIFEKEFKTSFSGNFDFIEGSGFVSEEKNYNSPIVPAQMKIFKIAEKKRDGENDFSN